MSTGPAPLRAVIYTRVSLDRSGEGESNKRQEEACRMLCTMRGWEVVDSFEDVSVSAYSSKSQRDGWQAVLAEMSAGRCDVVVAWKMDRITRTVQGLVELVMLSRETGVSIATTDGMLDLTTPTGKAVAMILATVAELEVELKAERQVLANAARRSQGKPWQSGFKSFGYTLAGEVVEEEAELIRSGAQAFLDGRSLGQIALDWQASGVKPRSGRAWRNTSVRTILANPRLAGLMTFGGKVTGVEGQWEPILTQATSQLIRDRLTDPARLQGGSKFGPKAENLLTGIAVCETCEAQNTEAEAVGEDERVVPTVFGRGSDGKGQPCYRCAGSHVMTARAAADELVVRALAVAADTLPPGVVLAIPKAGADTATHAAIEEQNGLLKELGASYAAGEVPLAVVTASSSAIEARISELKAGLTGGATPYDPRKLNDAAVADFASLDLAGQRAVLARVARVTLRPKGRGRKGVPISEQVWMDLRVRDTDGEERWLPVLRGAEGVNARLEGAVFTQPSDLISTSIHAHLETAR